MATRGTMLDRIASIIGNDDTSFRTYLEGSFNNMLDALFDMHDWCFKGGVGTFNTVAGTESYNLRTSSTDIRSAQDVEVIWDKTNQRFLNPCELRDIRKTNPAQDQTSKPSSFARWGANTIFLYAIPDDTYIINYLYIKKATYATADANDIETTLGIPTYLHYLLEKMVLAEAFLFDDESRRNSMLEEINGIWRPAAINADMKHLENSARFKFWEEELRQTGVSYDQYLARTWAGGY